MNITRRSFLAGILALGVAPAVVKASSIMRVRPIVLPGDPEFELITEEIGRYESIRFIESTPDIHAIIVAMKRQHIPPGPDGNYIAIVHPSYMNEIQKLKAKKLKAKKMRRRW